MKPTSAFRTTNTPTRDSITYKHGAVVIEGYESLTNREFVDKGLEFIYNRQTGLSYGLILEKHISTGKELYIHTTSSAENTERIKAHGLNLSQADDMCNLGAGLYSYRMDAAKHFWGSRTTHSATIFSMHPGQIWYSVIWYEDGNSCLGEVFIAEEDFTTVVIRDVVDYTDFKERYAAGFYDAEVDMTDKCLQDFYRIDKDLFDAHRKQVEQVKGVYGISKQLPHILNSIYYEQVDD